MTFLYVVIALVIVFDFINGFHDSANSIATVVSTKVLSPFSAVLLAATFNFIAFTVFPLKVATTIGKSRPAIANAIRLLSLNDEIKDFVATGRLSSGHARALIAVGDIEIRNKIAEEVIKDSLNVRDTEKIVQKMQKKAKKPKKKELDCELVEIQDKLKNILGTKVKLVSGNKKGKIIIEYYSNEDLERILEIMNRLK